MFPVTNRHKGRPIIIVGTSPFEMKMSQLHDLFYGNVIMGVNRAILEFHCDYLVVCDTHRIHDRMPGVLDKVKETGCKTFFSRDVRHDDVGDPTWWFTRPKGSLDANCWPVPGYALPTEWKEAAPGVGILQHVCTVATAAMNLAQIMGASSIILYKVDLTGDTRFGKKIVPWAEFAPRVNEFIKKLSVPVYKTNPDSPLEVPLYADSY